MGHIYLGRLLSTIHIFILKHHGIGHIWNITGNVFLKHHDIGHILLVKF